MSHIIECSQLTVRYKSTTAIDNIQLSIPAGVTVGIIGPDGVGKSTLLSLIAGERMMQQGSLQVLGGNMRDKKHREAICSDIAYMPQGLGKNLYPTLSVEENLQFFAKLFGHSRKQRRARIDNLTKRTGLYPFLSRPAGKLSGGMKQKLGLCCALIHDPRLLILDEPTTGVDPLARSQFWSLIRDIHTAQPNITVLVATAYMDEAQQFNHLIALNAGKILATGSPQDLLARTQTSNLESAFIALLPSEIKHHHSVEVQPYNAAIHSETAIEAKNLTMKFSDFVAVDKVSFTIGKGEIFGFLGSNGCGKSTTMKMLTGLLPQTSGEAWLLGSPLAANDINTRYRVGYMSQSFSLYTELTVRQNLVLHAKLFKVPANKVEGRVDEMLNRFALSQHQHSLPHALPLGIRQRLSLAVAMVHKPEVLILDEPTDGLDPNQKHGARQLIKRLGESKAIIFSTHILEEVDAACSRAIIIDNGRIVANGTPDELKKQSNTGRLDDLFRELTLSDTDQREAA